MTDQETIEQLTHERDLARYWLIRNLMLIRTGEERELAIRYLCSLGLDPWDVAATQRLRYEVEHPGYTE